MDEIGYVLKVRFTVRFSKVRDTDSRVRDKVSRVRSYNI